MRCEILRPFTFSRDGVTAQRVETGSVVDIPDRLCAGLELEGYLRRYADYDDTRKAIVVAENKMIPATPENKRRPGRPRKSR